MKSTLNNVLIFAVGAAIGSAATWYFVKTKYERIAQEEIDSVKEEFSKGSHVDIPSLAEQCNMSQTYFRRLFHNLYGVSPKQYILSARLRWAKTMLKSTEDSVTEIAKSCGFDNVYYCCSCKRFCLL